ncbi:hypothetical protein B1748_01940 [Paenibacillus sp. MY03]|uniref:hypothetical protein n=1 Tax=Paenibacillus sp. MY03 TaxID=302980 RepID=UPI000B3BEC11|nr:hypothetical protein [Paenibacillus sp. MY03]OUS78383.1 hypothetical protein B1748_01940 [Paenibacillus sp. MY03]
MEMRRSLQIVAYMFATVIASVASTKIEINIILMLFLFIKIVGDIVYSCLTKLPSILVYLFLGLAPFFPKIILNINFAICVLLFCFFWTYYAFKLGGLLEDYFLKRSEEVPFQLYMLFVKVFTWGVGVLLSTYFAVTIFSAVIATFFPDSTFSKIISLSEVRSFFVVMMLHGLTAYALFRVFMILRAWLNSTTYSSVSVKVVAPTVSVLVLVILPDLLYSTFYNYQIQMHSDKQGVLLELLEFFQSFYFAFSLHYSMPIIDGTTYTSSALKLISNNHTLKFIQFGHIVIAKIYELIALAVVVDLIRNKFFGSNSKSLPS